MLRSVRGRRCAAAAVAGLCCAAALSVGLVASPTTAKAATLGRAAPLPGTGLPVIEPAWARSITGLGASNDAARDVVVSGSGTVWAAGSSGLSTNAEDMLLVRVSANGVRASKYRWDSPAHRADGAVALALAPDGSIYTAGYSTRRATGRDLTLVKWSPQGKVLWMRRYDGPNHDWDSATDVVVDAAGNVTVCGESGVAGDTDWVVASWSKSGVTRWVRRYAGGGMGPDAASEMAVDVSGNVYVAGSIVRSDLHARARTVKYDRSGQELWRHEYDGSENAGAWLRTIALSPSGGVCVGGMEQHATSGVDPVVLSYSSTGSLTVLGNGTQRPGDAMMTDLAVALDGSIVTGGWQSDGVAPSPYAALYGTSGSLVQDWLWAGATSDSESLITAVAADAYGDVFWAGRYRAPSAATSLVVGRRSVANIGGDWTGAWTAGGGSVEASAATTHGTALYVVGHHSTLGKGTNLFVLKYQP